ncbi:MAG: VCBS repeat-containing protein [Deltaproteobacteria bacterium]|nr:VCBS repeat-containing protein [Nannocystaceae bacterium]
MSAACGEDVTLGGLDTGTATGTSTIQGSSTSTSPGTASTTASESGSGTLDSEDAGGTPLLDVGAESGSESGGPSVDLCTVPDDAMDAPGPCDYEAPADSFAPVLKWEWQGEGQNVNSATTPLVANLTDDNNDGSIDLCDTPDVIVIANGEPTGPGTIYVLDGASGEVHFSIDHALDDMNLALGDLDGDGLPEIAAQSFHGGAVVFEHDGTLKWESPTGVWPRFNAISLADLDNDEDVELVYPHGLILDHEGNVLVGASDEFWEGSTPLGVDLDGDDDLEIVDGRRVFHHDGTPMWTISDQACPAPPDGAEIMVGIADFDADGDPDIFMSGVTGLGPATFCIVDGNGELLFSLSALPEAPDAIDWLRPPAIHDVNGDGTPEVGVGGSTQYFAVLGVQGGVLAPLFVASGLDDTGNAGATAFDFLGDGTAEAIYMDQTQLHAYDSTGGVEFTVARTSYTQIEYPVVADIDNDGSAEFIVTSNGGESPVRAFHDADDRWVPARRIWNQHAYHVTNVREDGTIPAIQAPFWQQLNTFRTQSQIGTTSGETCRPPPN